ncbi:hypothetical protein TVAG_366420 [Trichomonas vaginalis G3]|uniref:UAS domain-containing protein n=1 Tax=Trichomonas vaginalis (strain ATCC PRA-98 / G3) TaxID=412133 RepID=A2DHT6_TRIV3|nr:FAS-associated protein family [Trichomonas vaginalis G3]EAY20134.1 hypothetical protein TVAG_366420 [Trichomonas vaginalis G3]KAI5528086.1 FAS-associated protein family [Trichomonas vaginalis G3]|eukprot:XP_001581120.1 hypothetical protein [Trichomonas vaginalis G3]
MEGDALIEENKFTVMVFLKKLKHRFQFGSLPLENEHYNVHNDFSASWGFQYDSHPGPIEEALVDAKNLNRSLFIFIYCRENLVTQRVINVLSSDSVSQEMQRSFLFLPLDVTTPDGITVANMLKFHQLPLIALVRPRGNTLASSQVFVQHEGLIGESVLLSYIRIEHNEPDNNQTEVVNDQDAAYQRALEREDERIRQEEMHQEEEQMQEEMSHVLQQSVDDAFAALPPPPTTGERVIVKFQFPNADANQTRAFPRDGPISMLFTFARKFVFPDEFVLKAGFPPAELEETETPISQTIQEKQFVCYVEIQ